MLKLEADYFPAKQKFETVFSSGSLQIFAIPQNVLKLDARSEAYKKRFQEIDPAKLTDFDCRSLHYEIWEGQQCLGGFRLCPVGHGQSEVEEVFKTFQFMPHSFELGRLWVKSQNRGHGRKCMRVIAQWMQQQDTIIYFKQSSLLGNISKAMGAVSEEIYSWNPRLQYFVELFRFRGNYA